MEFKTFISANIYVCYYFICNEFIIESTIAIDQGAHYVRLLTNLMSIAISLVYSCVNI